jgi:hypothetical protein
MIGMLSGYIHGVPFAIVDCDLEGHDAVLMVVLDSAFAEKVTTELRRRDVRAEVVNIAPGDGPDWLPLPI